MTSSKVMVFRKYLYQYSEMLLLCFIWYRFKNIDLPLTSIKIHYIYILQNIESNEVLLSTSKRRKRKVFFYRANLSTTCATGVNNYPLNNILPSSTITTYIVDDVTMVFHSDSVYKLVFLCKELLETKDHGILCF